MVCCGTEPSSRVCARPPRVHYLLCGDYKRDLHALKVGKGIVDALVQLREKKGMRGRGEAAARKPILATPLWACFTLIIPGSSHNCPSS